MIYGTSGKTNVSKQVRRTCFESTDRLLLGRILKTVLEIHRECALRVHVQVNYYFEDMLRVQ